MKSGLKKIILIEFFMLFIIILGFFISNIFSSLGLILFLGIVLAVLIYLFGFDRRIQINEKKVMINIVIYLLIYFLITYILGLFVGFNKTVYSYSFVNLTKNIIPTFIIIVLSELIRFQLVKKSNNKYAIIGSAILFVLIDVVISYKAYNFAIADEVREFIGLVLLGSISKNTFLTMSACKTGFINNIVYRIITEMYIFIVPIVPAFDIYIKSAILIVLPLILCFIIVNTIKIKKNDKKTVHNGKTKILGLCMFILLILIVLLNSGFLKYQSLTVGSNSMMPYMSRGDIVIIDKLTNEEMLNIQEGDILVFNYKKKMVAHRVYEVIKKNNTVYFRTKGDNNEQVDANIVGVEEVLGVSKVRIKYLGLPSIWLHDLIE